MKKQRKSEWQLFLERNPEILPHIAAQGMPIKDFYAELDRFDDSKTPRKPHNPADSAIP